jgi:transketolase
VLLYAVLHLTGYDLPFEELKRFRQWGRAAPAIRNAASPPGWR